MMRLRPAATAVPLLHDIPPRLDRGDQPVATALGRLSRGLSVVALGGCAVLALAALPRAGKPDRAAQAVLPQTAAPSGIARTEPVAPAASP